MAPKGRHRRLSLSRGVKQPEPARVVTVVASGTDTPTLESYAASEVDGWGRWNYSRTDSLLDSMSAPYAQDWRRAHSGGCAPIAAPGTDLNAAWTGPRSYALNEEPNRPVDFLHATSFQQPFRKSHIVVERTVHDDKPMHPPATFILDLCTRDVSAEPL
jgi:hypothetical protein